MLTSKPEIRIESTATEAQELLASNQIKDAFHYYTTSWYKSKLANQQIGVTPSTIKSNKR